MPVNGVHLNVEVAGSGPPLVLLHGFTGSIAAWEAHAAEFARRHLIVAIDHLGHGRSDAPADPARYALDHAVEDIQRVMDRLDLRQASLLGYSMGGRVALALAIRAPDRVRALILESASPGIADAEARRERAQRDAELAETIEREGVAAFVSRWERLPLFTSQARLPDDVRARLRAQRLGHSPSGLANSLRGLGQGVQPPLHRLLRAQRAPALVIAGELDPAYCELARAMAGLMPEADLALVPDAGHAVHLEQPEVFHRLVAEFLDEVITDRARG